jgi:hypothetical protein
MISSRIAHSPQSSFENFHAADVNQLSSGSTLSATQISGTRAEFLHRFSTKFYLMQVSLRSAGNT